MIPDGSPLRALAERVAQSRHDNRPRRHVGPWTEVDPTWQYTLTSEVAGVIEHLVEVVPPLRAYLEGNSSTATAHPDGAPISRGDWAKHVAGHLDHGGERTVALTAGEATAVATLLDELAGVYPDGPDRGQDPLSRVARQAAMRLWDRLGI